MTDDRIKELTRWAIQQYVVRGDMDRCLADAIRAAITEATAAERVLGK